MAGNIPEYPLYLAGEWRKTSQPLEVRSPYSQEVVGITFLAGEEELEKAIASAVSAFEITRKLSAFDRYQILYRISQGIESKAEEIARTIAMESGKPLKDARVEVNRAILTFQTAAEEAKRINGEVLALDLRPEARGRLGIVRRFPRGPVLGITPFNFPLNLAAHKIAPALAAGCPIVVKPPSQTPLTLLKTASIFEEAGVPHGALSIIPLPPSLHDRLVTDERFKVLTFTGSSAVGWQLKAKAGKKQVLLELGGNAGLIIEPDAPLDYAIDRTANGAFSFAGQSCISVQRVFLHEQIFEAFADKLVQKARNLRLGDPLDPETDLGPMINPEAVSRTEEWVQEALSANARLLYGGKKQPHNIFEPTILTEVPLEARVCRQEVFAPVVVLFRYSSFEEALQLINQTAYGLQAGLFTRDFSKILKAFEEIQVGGLIVGDVPTWRIDPMPYGGTKDSGIGREGLKYAIEEMTELKIMVINREGLAGK